MYEGAERGGRGQSGGEGSAATDLLSGGPLSLLRLY